MVKEIKVRRVGGSVGATIPKDMADRLRLAAGDTLFVVETEDGLLLTPYDSAAREALDVAERAAKRYRNALRELAR